MRFLRHFALVLLLGAVVFSVWAGIRFNQGRNKDVPVLECDTQRLEISVHEEDLRLGLKAYDKTDGDITENILVGSVSHFVEPGTVNVKYVVFDQHHNSATLTRQVHFTDYTPPRFVLTKNPVYTRGDKFDLLEHLQANDSLDGDITSRVRVLVSGVSNYASGVFPLTVEVSNSCGETAQLTLQVTYLDKRPTAMVQLHEYLLYLQPGEAFDPYTVLSSVTDREGVALDKSKVTVQGVLDTSTPGTYELTFAYNEEKLSGQASLTVVVTEEVAQ